MPPARRTNEARRLLDGTPDAAPDTALHRALFAELGIGGLVVPERFGGADAGWAALHVVLAELGRALACVPFVPSAVLATQLLLASGDEAACASLLPGIADGSVVATVAVVERGGQVGRVDARALLRAARRPPSRTATAGG